jgi:RNA polymerase sigma-70 factor (ECF subfamily)
MPGRDERFEQDVIRFIGRLYPAVPRMTRNRSDAEDLIQETFAKACAGFHQFQPGTNLRAYMCGPGRQRNSTSGFRDVPRL